MICLRCQSVEDGFVDFERLVRFQTQDGTEEVLVAKGLVLEGPHLRVYPVDGVMNGKVLVELPAETASGKWRVWVRTADLEGCTDHK